MIMQYDQTLNSGLAARRQSRTYRELDATLVQMVMGCLSARSATVARLRRMPDGAKNWLVSAQMRAGDPAVFTPMGSSSEQMQSELPGFGRMIWPALTKPSWNEALRTIDPVSTRAVEGRKGFNVLTVFEVVSDVSGSCILEIETGADMLAHDQRMVSTILRTYRQMDALIPGEHRDSVTGLLNVQAFEKLFRDNAAKAAGSPLDIGELLALDPFVGEEDVSFVMGGDIDRRANPTAPASWLGLIGIDSFSRINATHGHLVGDDVLLLFARIVRSTFRHHDRFYRLGGDEVGVVLRCPNQESALSALERFRIQLMRYDFPLVGRITASVGYTRIKTSDTAQCIISRAQTALGEAKQAGVDRIVCLDDEMIGQAT